MGRATMTIAGCVLLQGLPGFTQITIHPHSAQQGFDVLRPDAVGHPVITGVSMNTNAVISQFAVTNYAAKAVTSTEYGWRISTPLGCTDSTLPVRWETAKSDVTIAPGAEATINTPEALSRPGTAKELAELADTNKTSVVLVTIGC